MLICPIIRGWAVIGRAGKYLSPAGVDWLDVAEGPVLYNHHSGPLTLWHKGKLRTREYPAGLLRITS